MQDGKKYIIVSEPPIGLSLIKNDCQAGDLCVPTKKGESLVSILNKICEKAGSGTPGTKGDKGDKGDQGPKGDQGDQGDPGPNLLVVGGTHIANGTNTWILYDDNGVLGKLDPSSLTPNLQAVTDVGNITTNPIFADYFQANNLDNILVATNDGGSNYIQFWTQNPIVGNNQIEIPQADGLMAISASGNIALSAAGDITFTGILPVPNGGTGIGSYTIGDILYASGATTLSKLGISTDGKVLTLSGGLPSWQTPAVTGWALPGNAGTNSSVNFIGTTDNQDVTFKRNSTYAGTIVAAGVGTGLPTFSLMEVSAFYATFQGLKITSGAAPLTRYVTFDPSPLTSNRVYSMRDSSGTLALETAASGSFTTVDSKTVTVLNGLITSIV